MVRRMRDPPDENPCTASRDIEEFGFFLTPMLGHRSKSFETLLRGGSICPQECCASLVSGQRRNRQLDAEKILHPIVFAHTLMDHLFVNSAAARLGFPVHFGVVKHRPYR